MLLIAVQDKKYPVVSFALDVLIIHRFQEIKPNALIQSADRIKLLKSMVNVPNVENFNRFRLIRENVRLFNYLIQLKKTNR